MKQRKEQQSIMLKPHRFFSPGLFVMAVILALCNLYGNLAIFGKPIDFNLVVLCEICFNSVVWYSVFYLLFALVSSELIEKRWTFAPFVSFKQHIVRNTAIVLSSFWLGHLLIKYPFGSFPDSYEQIVQGMGYAPLTTANPIFHTMLMTGFIKFGLLIGSKEVGAFLFVLVGMAAMVLIFSYIISFLDKIGTPDCLLLCSVLFFALSPYITGHVGQNLKDAYYSTFLALYIVLLAEYLLDRPGFAGKRAALFLLASAMVILLRNNGVLNVVPTAVVMMIRELRRREKRWRQMLMLLTLSLLLPLLVYAGIVKLTHPAAGSVAETLSLPFQQTARFVKNKSELVTEEEREIIDRILPYDKLPELYSEFISDPVKNSYNQSASAQDLKAYFQVWFRQFFRSPVTYFAATARQNIYLLYPRYNVYAYCVDSNAWLSEADALIFFETPDFIKSMQPSYCRALYSLHTDPILSICNNLSSYVILFLAMFIYVTESGSKAHYLICIPLFMSLLAVVMGPCILGHPRYVLPIIWTAPLWFGVFTFCLREAKAREKEQDPLTVPSSATTRRERSPLTARSSRSSPTRPTVTLPSSPGASSVSSTCSSAPAFT